MIKVQTLRLRGLFASPLLALAACSGSPMHFGGVTANPEASPLTTESTATSTADASVQDPQGQEPTRRQALVKQAVENARRSLDLRLFEEARNEAAFALELDNDNTDAREILRRCNKILGKDVTMTGGGLDEALVIERIRLERERALVENELQLGEALMQN
ncbi:MAG: hypothetical protein KDC98_07630, partial [Planctomycetes bacterium]|nr:hypothetical protein [Planctomycetota bacterium]